MTILFILLKSSAIVFFFYEFNCIYSAPMTYILLIHNEPWRRVLLSDVWLFPSACVQRTVVTRSGQGHLRTGQLPAMAMCTCTSLRKLPTIYFGKFINNVIIFND